MEPIIAKKAAANRNGSNKCKNAYTAEEIIESIKILYQRTGRLNAKDLDRYNDLPSASTINRKVGWSRACELAFPDNYRKYEKSHLTKEECIEALRELNRREGKCEKTSLANYSDLPTADQIMKSFASWNDALTAADIPINMPRYTDEELEEALRELARRENGQCNLHCLEKYSDLPASVTYYRRYGTAEAAKKAAGLA